MWRRSRDIGRSVGGCVRRSGSRDVGRGVARSRGGRVGGCVTRLGLLLYDAGRDNDAIVGWRGRGGGKRVGG